MRSFAASFGIAAISLLGFVTGCAEATPTPSAPVMRLALSTTASSAPHLHVGDVRVINKRINLREPVLMSAVGNEVTVTWAMREREGITLALDPETLDQRVISPFTFPARDARHPASTLSHEKVIVPLADGTSVAIWTDEEESRVLAQKTNDLAEPVIVSRAGSTVVGSPKAATADGRHVVITFVTADQVSFELVAATLEVSNQP